VLITVGVFRNCYARISKPLYLRKWRGMAENARVLPAVLANRKGITMKFRHPILAVSAFGAAQP
jgi:hypothetical protein